VLSHANSLLVNQPPDFTDFSVDDFPNSLMAPHNAAAARSAGCCICRHGSLRWRIFREDERACCGMEDARLESGPKRPKI